MLDKTIYSLSGQVLTGQPRRVKIEGKNVTRVDVYYNGRPAATGDLVNGEVSLDLPSWVPAAATLELRGYL